MPGSAIRITVQDHVPECDLIDSLDLALLAAEGLFGAAALRKELRCDRQGRAVTISTGSEPGRALARLLAQFLAKEFGPRSFRLATISGPHPRSACATADD
jgi:hypothetical protein